MKSFNRNRFNKSFNRNQYNAPPRRYITDAVLQWSGALGVPVAGMVPFEHLVGMVLQDGSELQYRSYRPEVIDGRICMNDETCAVGDDGRLHGHTLRLADKTAWIKTDTGASVANDRGRFTDMDGNPVLREQVTRKLYSVREIEHQLHLVNRGDAPTVAYDVRRIAGLLHRGTLLCSEYIEAAAFAEKAREVLKDPSREVGAIRFPKLYVEVDYNIVDVAFAEFVKRDGLEQVVLGYVYGRYVPSNDKAHVAGTVIEVAEDCRSLKIECKTATDQVEHMLFTSPYANTLLMVDVGSVVRPDTQLWSVHISPEKALAHSYDEAREALGEDFDAVWKELANDMKYGIDASAAGYDGRVIYPLAAVPWPLPAAGFRILADLSDCAEPQLVHSCALIGEDDLTSYDLLHSRFASTRRQRERQQPRDVTSVNELVKETGKMIAPNPTHAEQETSPVMADVLQQETLVTAA